MERQYGCNPDKRAFLLTERGVDLLDLDELFSDPFRIEFEDLRFDYGESRRIVVGMVRSQFVTAVYTMRKELTWVITAWPSNRKERERYVRERRDHIQNWT